MCFQYHPSSAITETSLSTSCQSILYQSLQGSARKCLKFDRVFPIFRPWNSARKLVITIYVKYPGESCGKILLSIEVSRAWKCSVEEQLPLWAEVPKDRTKDECTYHSKKESHGVVVGIAPVCPMLLPQACLKLGSGGPRKLTWKLQVMRPRFGNNQFFDHNLISPVIPARTRSNWGF